MSYKFYLIEAIYKSRKKSKHVIRVKSLKSLREYLKKYKVGSPFGTNAVIHYNHKRLHPKNGADRKLLIRKGAGKGGNIWTERGGKRCAYKFNK